MLITNIIRFFIVLILQLLVFNNIQFSGYVNIYFYVLFILLLPFETPRWLMLISAFLLGLTVDIFSHSYGMHAAASVFISYLRPYVVYFIRSKKELDVGVLPTIGHMGFSWFLSYASILIFIHHFIYFFLEVFRLNDFLTTFYRVIYSSIATIIVIIAEQFLFFKQRK
ncbi:MAG: rod shape-determining protein MreD [Bacteroidales bacterium]|jgi:rod shape-determining protein MreD|nr:rod shape-determining protein MreD [Bacteroidales bacterium]